MTPTTQRINRWRAFALLAVAYFMTIVDLTIVNVSLPTIGHDLHFTQPACSGWRPLTRSHSVACCCWAAAPPIWLAAGGS